MSDCKALNSQGKPCKAKAMANGFCYRHNPEISDESKREASKRGGAKFDPRTIAETYEPIKGQTLGDLQDALLRNANDLRAGKIDARTSNAVVQNIIALIEAHKVGDINQRLTQLEQAVFNDPRGYNKL